MTHDPTVKSGPKERRFLDALRELFVGAKVDGKSGYINLMRIKASYRAFQAHDRGQRAR